MGDIPLVSSVRRIAGRNKANKQAKQAETHRPAHQGTSHLSDTSLVPSPGNNGHLEQQMIQLSTALAQMQRQQEDRDLIGTQGKVEMAKLLIMTPKEVQRETTRITRRMGQLLPSYEVIGYTRRLKTDRPKNANGTYMTLREIWRDAYLSYQRSVMRPGGQTTHLDQLHELAGLRTGESGEEVDNRYVGR